MRGTVGSLKGSLKGCCKGHLGPYDQGAMRATLRDLEPQH